MKEKVACKWLITTHHRIHLLNNINSTSETDEKIKKKKKKNSLSIFSALEYFSILGDRNIHAWATANRIYITGPLCLIIVHYFG